MLWRLIKALRRRRSAPSSDGAASFESPDASLREGQTLQQEGRLAAALQCYEKCAAAYPAYLPARAAIADVLSASWRIEECIAACAEGLDAAPRNLSVFSSYLLYSHYAARPAPRHLFDLHRRYGQLARDAAPEPHAAYPRLSRNPARPLRLGYVSRDFCRHSVASFLEPVIEHHDRSRFLVYCYYTRDHEDDVTARFRSSAHAWRDAHADDANALAARVYDDQIDVLVDLGGHTHGGALPVFARRPAPVQFTWLGYPDTTGVQTIAYRISDEIADPAPGADALHTERLIRLAPPFVCYRPPAESPAIVPRDSSAPVVFGSFNVIMKVNEPLIRVWAQILQSIPGSRLLLKSPLLEHDETVERVRRSFEKHGVAPERLELRSPTPSRRDHLAAYNEIDIALDTFPYNGTTTTCEALWMGKPVVTLAGAVHMSRVGATLLRSAGLQELVATTAKEYVQIAIDLAGDRVRRTALSGTMRDRLVASALLDHAGYTRKLERALQTEWLKWLEGVA